MNWLQKLPDSQRSPAGWEWVILKKLPIIFVGSTVVPALWYWLATLYPAPTPGESVDKYLTGVGIAAIATAITAWTAIFTVAVGCCIVVLMKGPAYVADRYPLQDADEPRTDPVDDAPEQGAHPRHADD
jgi:hypothetical protein